MSQIPEKKFSYAMLLGGLSVNLNHLKSHKSTMKSLDSNFFHVQLHAMRVENKQEIALKCVYYMLSELRINKKLL